MANLNDFTARATPRNIAVFAIGTVALMMVLWPYLSPGPAADELVAKVNSEYRSISAVAASISNQDLPGLTTEREIALDGGVVTGLTERISSGAARPMLTITNRDGIFLSFESRSCWSSTRRAEEAIDLGVGEGFIPTRGVDFDKPKQSGGLIHLTGRRSDHGATLHSTYVIDASSHRVVSAEYRVTGVPTEHVTRFKFRPLATAPDVSTPAPLCAFGLGGTSGS